MRTTLAYLVFIMPPMPCWMLVHGGAKFRAVAIENLMKKKGKFDYILLDTSSIAPLKPSRDRCVQYSDEIRAKIGKFALKHGNSAAMKHFYSELGHEIPESTIRGMRDKYQLMSERAGPGGVASLGQGPKGQPA